jgi:GT2 family glycosyltransferase
VWFRCVSYGLFLRRTLVRRTGGFDPLLGLGAHWGSGEELDYVLRALRMGARVWYEHGLFVVHPRRPARAWLAGRAFRYGRGIGRVLRKHRLPFAFCAYMAARPLAGALASVLHLRPGAAICFSAGAAGRIVGLLRPGPLDAME